jgi:hypothetical protein
MLMAVSLSASTDHRNQNEHAEQICGLPGNLTN